MSISRVWIYNTGVRETTIIYVLISEILEENWKDMNYEMGKSSKDYESEGGKHGGAED